MSIPPATPQPLSGIRVLDLTRLLPGPWGTMVLADLGAEVIKIESPDDGDGSRHATPRYVGGDDGESVYFSGVNRNKRSVALDLKSPDGKRVFERLARESDVVVESFRPGTAERLGIGYDTLRAWNPRIVCCAISGYGQHGTRSTHAGHDLNIAGMSGLLQISPGDTPAMPAVLMGDYAGASMAVVAILAALVDRERHGRGAFIDVAMLDALMSWTGIQMIQPFIHAVDPSQPGSVEGWGGNPRYGIYRTRDARYVTVSLLEKKYWDAFCALQGRPDLVNPDETAADRLTAHGERGDGFRRFLEATFASKDRDTWVAELTPLAIPVCPVLTPEEAFASRDGRERRHFFELPVARLGMTIPQNGFPFQMTLSDGTDAFAVRRAPPALGEANAEYGVSTEPPHVDVS